MNEKKNVLFNVELQVRSSDYFPVELLLVVDPKNSRARHCLGSEWKIIVNFFFGTIFSRVIKCKWNFGVIYWYPREVREIPIFLNSLKFRDFLILIEMNDFFDNFIKICEFSKKIIKTWEISPDFLTKFPQYS